MPGIGHLIYAFCLIIPILYFTRNDKDEFNYKVAFIFFINNLFGPDASQIFVGAPFHSILGFAIFAIPLSLYFSYFSRFSLEKADNFIRLEFIDEGIREVNWKNSYCLTVAGGISHFFIDQFYHLHQKMMIWPGIDISQDQMLAWGGSAYHVVDPRMIIGYALMIVAIIMSYYAFRKGFKETIKLFCIVLGIELLLIFTLGQETFGGERELGVVFHTVIYVLIPLFLVFYAAADIRDNPNETPDEPKIDRELLLKIVSIISSIFAVFWVILSISVLVDPEILGSYLASKLGGDPSQISTVLRILALVILCISLPLLVGSIGLLFKINFCRDIVIALYLVLIIFAFPFAMALFLNENEVKEMFLKKTE